MEPPSDRDIERLRAIARRVGELAHGRPEVVERLQRSWTDYIALHVGHMEEEREKALLQRKFAKEVLKKGFLNEQPRKDHEPAWHQEPFRVRIPARLAAQSRAANTPAKLASYHTKVAAAILRYIRDEDEIADCTDPVKRKKLFKRRWTSHPLGRFVTETFVVGVRVRPECKVSPHPLFCNWREFKTLPLATRITVALATLVVLHDELSATPILRPFPHDLPEEEAEAHQLIVAWAVWECLSSTSEAGESSAPPRPDPNRLSVERAEAFLVLLKDEMKKILTPDVVDLASGADSRPHAESRANAPVTAFRSEPEVCPARTLREAVDWYLGPVDATLKAADEGVRAADGESVIVKLSMLPPRWGIDLFMFRFLGFQDWLTSPPQETVVDPSVKQPLISHAANYPKTIRPLTRYDGPPVLRTLSMPRHAIEELRLDARCMRTLAGPTSAGVTESPTGPIVWIRADDACKRFHMHPDTISKRARREKWNVKLSGKMNCYDLADLKRIWFAKQSKEDQLRSD